MNIKMELLKSGIADFITRNLESFEIDENKITSTVAINMLSEIQNIIKEDSNSDFEVVDKIVSVFEKYNIDFGFRHDF